MKMRKLNVSDDGCWGR